MGNPENEIASFRALRPQNLAISNQPARRKPNLNQRLGRCSRTTIPGEWPIAGSAGTPPASNAKATIAGRGRMWVMAALSQPIGGAIGATAHATGA
jgi:hypothetical protein